MKKTTVIIPTRNRSKYLDRALQYYKSRWKGVSIIIADSSTFEHRTENKKMIERYASHVCIIYREHEESAEYYEKVKKSIDAVNTPYIVICADDDFLVPQTIERCVLFLEENDDYSVCRGLLYNFYLEKGGIFNWLPVHHMHSIEFDTAIQRLTDIRLAHLGAVNAVYRKNILQDIYTQVCEHMPTLSWYSIMFIELLTLIHGKLKILDIPHQFQEKNDKTTGACLERFTGNMLMKECLWKERNIFSMCLIRNLRLKENISIEKAYILSTRIVQNLSEDMIAASIPLPQHNKKQNKSKPAFIKKPSSIKKIVKSCMPFFFIKLVRKIKNRDVKMTLVQQYEPLIREKQSLFCGDYELIKKRVVDSHLYSAYQGGGMEWQRDQI